LKRTSTVRNVMWHRRLVEKNNEIKLKKLFPSILIIGTKYYTHYI